MAKKTKEAEMNLYYMNNGQAQKETLDDIMKRKKSKEREKRIKEKNTQNEEKFDLDTEIVIGMTNKNNKIRQEARRKEISKKEAKRKKKIKKIKHILKILILISIIIGGIIFATCSPIFNINDIEVINNNKVSKETAISLSGLAKGQNIFKFLKVNIQNNLKENPYIEEANIKRVLPNKIEIDITERVPKFSVPILGEYTYINSQGYFLEITQNELNLPIIYGVSTKEENIKPGNRLEEDDLMKLETVLKIMNVAKENNIDTIITSIDITDKNNYILRIEQEKKTVYLGDDTNLNSKILNVVLCIEKEKGKEGIIFVNGDFNQKFRPYFRENVAV